METLIHTSAIILEYLGVAIIVLGTIYSFLVYVFKKDRREYHILRQNIGRSILLGLEVLVGADIIAAIVTELDLQKVLTLGLIIIIRTVLSFSLEIELDGKLPWRKN